MGGGLYFVDSIWRLPVRQIRFHRTAATWDHKEDFKTTSALLSTNMPIIEWFNLEPDNKKKLNKFLCNLMNPIIVDC